MFHASDYGTLSQYFETDLEGYVYLELEQALQGNWELGKDDPVALAALVERNKEEKDQADMMLAKWRAEGVIGDL